MAVCPGIAADDREPDHPQPATSERSVARAAIEQGSDQEQRVREEFSGEVAQRSNGLLRSTNDRRDAVVLGSGSRSTQALRGGFSPIGLHGNAELLQAQLPEGRC